MKKYYWYSYVRYWFNSENHEQFFYEDILEDVHPFEQIDHMDREDSRYENCLLNYKEISKEEFDLFYKLANQ
ncbi:MAG: hypothetical protein JWR05_3480 [Mucilaginibacter sp.]|nr:hypothetical protein [Mucilaginibacter sp.]